MEIKISTFIKTFSDNKKPALNNDKLLIMSHYLHFKVAESITLFELGTGRMQELISPVGNFYNQ